MKVETPSFAFASPDAAMEALLAELSSVDVAAIAVEECAGRILAEAVEADRDHPAADVSAMDGYALRLADVARGTLPVAGEAAAGQPAPTLPEGAAIRIFTGGIVPEGAEVVIKREDIDESPEAICFTERVGDVKAGQNIRRQGENVRAGDVVIEPGATVTPTIAATLATFGCVQPRVHRRLRVAVLVTGREVLPPETTPEPWQLRDGNGITLASMLQQRWIEPVKVQRVGDDLDELTSVIGEAITGHDAVVLSGGVSAGDHDYVPEAVARCGGREVFHRLPIRPGKPIFAAIVESSDRAKPIIGLPGNPVSVAVTARRFALPALARLAGMVKAPEADGGVTIDNPDDRTLHLHWHRLVRLTSPGHAELIANMGSGDLAAAGRSDGFVAVEPGAMCSGNHPFYRWSL